MHEPGYRVLIRMMFLRLHDVLWYREAWVSIITIITVNDREQKGWTGNTILYGRTLIHQYDASLEVIRSLLLQCNHN
jgi:hypothetical protein